MYILYIITSRPPVWYINMYGSSRTEIFSGCRGKSEPQVQREDDKPESVRNRLEVFQANTEPVLEFYRKTNILSQDHLFSLPFSLDVIINNYKFCLPEPLFRNN